MCDQPSPSSSSPSRAKRVGGGVWLARVTPKEIRSPLMRFKLSGLFVCTQRTLSMNREIDFDKMQGLAPAIVQDAASGEVLMLGFMNREACKQTLTTGYVTF